MDINFSEFPLAIADFFGISEFAGGLILFAILFLVIELPLIYIGSGFDKEKKFSFIPELIGGVISLGLGVAFGWLHIFFLLLLCFLIAVLVARLWS